MAICVVHFRLCDEGREPKWICKGRRTVQTESLTRYSGISIRRCSGLMGRPLRGAVMCLGGVTVMTIVSAERRGSFLGLVDRYWRKSGYRIKAINNDAEVPAIYAQTKDGFGVSLSHRRKRPSLLRSGQPLCRGVGRSRVHHPAQRPFLRGRLSPAPPQRPLRLLVGPRVLTLRNLRLILAPGAHVPSGAWPVVRRRLPAAPSRCPLRLLVRGGALMADQRHRRHP